jgi:hypothetical protein
VPVTAGELEGAGDKAFPPARWSPANTKAAAVGISGALAVSDFLLVILLFMMYRLFHSMLSYCSMK